MAATTQLRWWCPVKRLLFGPSSCGLVLCKMHFSLHTKLGSERVFFFMLLLARWFPRYTSRKNRVNNNGTHAHTIKCCAVWAPALKNDATQRLCVCALKQGGTRGVLCFVHYKMHTHNKKVVYVFRWVVCFFGRMCMCVCVVCDVCVSHARDLWTTRRDERAAEARYCWCA